MAKLPFNVHAYTARLIGRENVSKLEGAMIELVKNTYDADASFCILYYENSTNTLFIADNGSGMTEKIIKNHWMTIGNSSKKERYKSGKGRIQTGAKGIGRFALDRISDECSMLTISREKRLEWKVNWSDFNSGTTITDVYAELNEVKYSFNDFTNNVTNIDFKKLINEEFSETGTIFKLNSLRDKWTSLLIESIKNNLATLIPPELEEIFKLYFFTEETETEKAQVRLNDGLFSYDYKIDFNADSEGLLKIKIHRNEFDFKDDFEQILNNAGFTKEDREYFKGLPIEYNMTLAEMLRLRDPDYKNTIGSFSGTLYFAKLGDSKEEKKKYYYKDFSNRRDYRDTFGGIKLYRDNFRVRPYGEPKTSNYDWLLLSQRKAKSPAGVSSTGQWRVHADQMLGAIKISRTNLELPDQANREGIVETTEFSLLREVLKGIIKLFEEDRQYVIRLLQKYYEFKNETELLEKEIKAKAEEEERKREKREQESKEKDTGNESEKDDFTSTPELIEVSKAKTVIDTKESIIRDLEDENRLLRALATTGIVTNTYIHEIKDSTHKLSLKIVMAKEALELDNDKDGALEYIREANHIKNSFNSWFKVTIESVRRDKRTMKVIELKLLLQDLISSWNDVASNKGIRVNLEMDELNFKCFPYEIESLFNNLITNSITSFDSARVEDKEISIKVYDSESGITIDYSDTGVGLSAAYKKNPRLILEPHETDKRNENGEPIGTGMGMWVIVKTVNEYNGMIDLSKNIESTEGFHITIKLKGSKSLKRG